MIERYKEQIETIKHYDTLYNRANEARLVVMIFSDHIVCRVMNSKSPTYKAYMFSEWGSYDLTTEPKKTKEQLKIEEMMKVSGKTGDVARVVCTNLYHAIKNKRINIE